MRRLLLPLALVAALAACGTDAPTATSSTGAGAGGSSSSATDAADATEAPAPSGASGVDLAFSAPTLDGGEVDFAALEGKDTVIWFWAPWCGSCAETAAGIDQVASELGDQAAFVGIGSQADTDELLEFADRFSLTHFPQVSDPDGAVWLRFADDVIRSSFLFIDDTGETSRTTYGELDEQALRERVEALIAS